MPPRRAGQPFRRVGKAGNTSYGPRKPKTVDASSLRSGEGTSQQDKLESTRLANRIDESMGFSRFESGKKKVGWLVNMHSTTIEDEDVPGGKAGVDYYFIGEDGDTFKATLEYDPYFLLAVKKGREQDVEEYCRRAFEGLIKSIKKVEKEDLSMPNHLTGYRRTFLQLTFANVNDLLAVRKAVAPIVEKNKKNVDAMDTYAEVATGNAGMDFFDNDDYEYEKRFMTTIDASDFIVDIREYDVPYHVRVAIDMDVRIGNWYTVDAKHGVISIKCIEDRLTPADPVVMAYDIETTKLPLKFPDAVIDQIMMVSYMIDGQGFLITNREIVSEDISDFEYTPKPEYHGPFMIFNEPDEKALIERFFEHIKEAKPTVMVTYNGDFFDWPFVEARASVLGIDMYQEIGFRKNSEDIYQSDYCAHMDAFAWVSRDSYLPQGSRGLKAVTMAKLGYDPDELDPELMTPYASERPQTLAEYSVSDAVATYYLYMKYVHPFIFALCKILPLGPDDALRKGTGTLCEMLLMVQAYQKGIALPNKHQAPKEAFWEGHLLESETYVGGHVEALEAGVFRSDIAYNFAVDPTAIDELINDLDAALKFSIEVEEKKKMEDVTNYDEIKAEIVNNLMQLKNTPNRNERPLIYHLDVASMYPNIMTTNRLQPDSMIKEADCAACDFNRPGKTCDRRMPWAWRGEYLPAKRDEYNMVRNALENERFPGKWPNSPMRSFQELSQDEQATLVRKRLTDYSKKIYHKVHDATTIEREAIICQRENPFYVDTVSGFRDRRYDFKGKQKVWKGKTDALKAAGAPAHEVEHAKKMIVLFDSMQLAHKVILNSFYGYVMRKGSRWYSLEMAGVTCLTGARIIQLARSLVERIGRPLELDTDGIWCILPATFPENFSFKMSNGKKMTISYPCTMLNHLVHAQYTNHQYETLVDPVNFRYEKHSDNSIFFEVDGPYKAMILPTSKEEDKNLKKRYAVFNHDGSLAELKGFEVKRRGELKLIKNFQAQIFKFFLEGTTLEETYGAVANVANRWLDILDTRGASLADEELIDLIVENKSMTKTLEEYGAQKSTAITTAKRLAEFLGEQMVKDKGLNCKYIISKTPRNAPVTERAIPMSIFSAEESVKRYFLRKWMKEDPGDMDPRTVLDWDYYRERLASVIQKLITIPAAYQKVRNPVPRVPHPDWLDRRIRQKEDKLQQKKMTDMFSKKPLTTGDANVANNKLSGDLEDFGAAKVSQAQSQMKKGIVTKMVAKRKEPEPAVPVQTDPYAALPKVMPSITNDYSGWLMYQKQKWKIQAQARKRRRQLFGEKPVDSNDAIGTFFRNQAQSLFISTWQLVQLRPTETPGEVKAFVLIDKKIHILKVIVPRQLYLNLRSEDLPDVSISGCSVEKVVNHTLPNGHPSIHLFKLEMSEQTYVHEAANISILFNHPSVEGVYEKQVPLNIRAILELGSSCTFDESQKGVLGKGLEQGFDLSALRRVPSQKTYLADASMSYLYVYHVSSGDRHIYAVFSTSKNDAHIIIQNKTKDAQGMPNVDRIYSDALRRRMEGNQGEPWQTMIDYQDSVHFKTTMVTTRRKALLELGDVVKKMKADETKPIIVVMQSPNQALLSHDIPILKDLPILPLHPDETDKQLPPLGWQAFIAKRLVSHYLDLGSWVAHLLELSRYGDIPLCNLESNDPRFLIDVAYARRLQKERVILWWSGQAKPDHAGYEKDDILGPLETVEMPSINNAGTYSSVCIDISLRNLAINTILSSSLVNDLEGADSVSFNPSAPSYDSANDGTNVIYSDNAFASAGIMVLREMVKAWWIEAVQAGSGFSMADVMVQHLVRWVSSPGSFLYDRSLHYYVEMMSKKTLQQLMADFKRVGSHIVFASPNRLLLQTTKAEVGNAYAYSQYIIKTIKSKPLFQFMELEIKEYWDYLVWYDEFNYGGKGCKEVVEEENQTIENIMCWQLAQFLPATLQPTFNDWVIEFIELMHARKRPTVTDGSTPRTTQIPLRPLTVDPNEQTQILPKTFTKPLFKQISTLLRRQHTEMLHPELAADYEFPKLPGSHLKLSNPVLQLVKSIMQVLSLDRAISLEARMLRKELLNLFEIREFSSEATFVNPSAVLSVRGVICDECTCSRDLDLCRDAALLPPVLPNNSDTAPAPPKWKCDNCDSTYDKLRIEEKLVSEVQKVVLEWCTQDLKCNKCKRLRSNEFMEHCACAGEWVGTKSRGDVKKKLNTYNNVAGFYGLKMLESVVQECLEGV
ncbi:DNA polymerase epsilon catalytic subunit [Parastagonospora nodorum]|nr:DNA polymerase epsilon catalytic subunit [Parastagonospora nodorum]